MSIQLGLRYCQHVDRSASARARAAETKRERSRAAILNAAARLFVERGWFPTSVESIAKAAGVGTATVYNHFSSKNLIAGHVFVPLVADLMANPRWLDSAVPPSDALREFLTALAASARYNTPLTVAFLEALNDSTARHGAVVTPDDPRSLVPIPGILSVIIQRGQDHGTFWPEPAATEAGPLFVNLLLLRVFTRPMESAEDTAELIWTIASRTYGIDRPW
jgi:AcrR family transcriptional regulator